MRVARRMTLSNMATMSWCVLNLKVNRTWTGSGSAPNHDDNKCCCASYRFNYSRLYSLHKQYIFTLTLTFTYLSPVSISPNSEVFTHQCKHGKDGPVFKASENRRQFQVKQKDSPFVQTNKWEKQKQKMWQSSSFLANMLTAKGIHQSINQSISQSISQSINPSINQTRPADFSPHICCRPTGCCP